MLRTLSARLIVVATTTALLVPVAAASAAPTVERIRIEGHATTLFEGPILTDGHAVRAASDSAGRRCDGTNLGAHPTPGPTPTAAADDAMRLAGMDFDARWYPGFDDYFLQRFGPDGQNPGTYAYWGILVNGIYTAIGGCQYRLNPGDQTLWVYDAFNNHHLLRLDGPGSIGEPTAVVEGGPSTAPVQQVFSVAVGQPLTVTVIQNQATGDVGAPGARIPAPSVPIAPVATAANGVQTVGGPPLATTNAAGIATVQWPTPGWKRIKATAPGFVRSNRLDVCVQPCGPPPADVATRVAPPSAVPPPRDPPPGDASLVTETPGGGSSSAGTGGSTGGNATNPILPDVPVGGGTIAGLQITADGNPTGLIGVRWRLEGHVALKGWRIDYRLLSPAKERKKRSKHRSSSKKKKKTTKARRRAADRARRAAPRAKDDDRKRDHDDRVKKGHWHRAASGTTKTTALLDLPVGREVELRIRFDPAAGATITRTLGRVLTPIDDRVRKVRYTGSTKRLRDARAWRQTVTRLRRKATVRARLAAGRPTLVLRSTKKRATVELLVKGHKPQRLKVPRHRDGRTVFVSGRRTTKRQTVRFRVRSGEVRVDGIGSRP